MADENDEGMDDQQEGNADIRALRKAARERDDLARQLAARERELAFAKSGLDFNDPKLKYFIKGYDGDLTPEAIKQQAEEDGFLPKTQRTDTEEVNAQQRIQSASSGATDQPPPNFRELLAEAKSPEEVMQLAAKHGMPTVWNRPAD